LPFDAKRLRRRPDIYRDSSQYRGFRKRTQSNQTIKYLNQPPTMTNRSNETTIFLSPLGGDARRAEGVKNKKS